MSQEKILVTSALPYANGPLHIGHIAGAYLPADIFVRYNKMCGNDVIYICGSDEHGVPITLKADQEKVSPQDIVDRYHKDIAYSFKKLNINFDNFSGTARPIHHKKSQEFFSQLNKTGYISEKETEQYFCEHDNMFLPDRFVEGTCPHCQFEHARGDECSRCTKWLESKELINPKCKICSNSPVMKQTKHWFLRLDLFQDRLKQWLDSKDNLKENVRQFAYGWFKEGLKERAITRDINWGIPVPCKGAEGKVLYVWFDAPIGYISSTIEWSEKIGEPDKWKEYWLDSNCKLIHFIGKDNIPFHIIVWTAILMGQADEYILPFDVPANEYLTIEGNKLSTSIGNVIWVNDFLKFFNTDFLRYYLAALAPETKDSDFAWKNFQEKINSDLSNILGNFVNRTLIFIQKNFDGITETANPTDDDSKELLLTLENVPNKIGDLLSNFKVREAIFEVINIARFGNRYFNLKKPWELIKQNKTECGSVLNICLMMIKKIAPLLFPFLPTSSQKMWEMIGMKDQVKDIKWNLINDLTISSGTKIGEIELLFPKIDDKKINEVIGVYQNSMTTIKVDEKEKALKKNEIGIEDFQNIDLRIGTVISGEKIEKSNKLLKLQVKLGNSTRQIISGVAKNYLPEELIGKQVVVVANLKKAKLMGELSEGMILFAEDNGQLTLVSPAKQLQEGSKVS